MRVIKRWTSGLFSRVDWMVSQVENHEALINNALRNAGEATARAKVQLGRVRKDGDQLRQRITTEEGEATSWRERAKSQAETNEEAAMECLRRSKRADQTVEQLRSRLVEHERAEQQLTRDVAKMEEQLVELREKRNLIRTRQSRAEALSGVQESGELFGAEVEDIFDRWETRVTEKELGGNCTLSTDSFAEGFTSREEEAQLREELNNLKGTAE